MNLHPVSADDAATMIVERHLFGPGPSIPQPEAKAALGLPLLGRLDPQLLEIMDETCDRLRQARGTTNARTLPLSATGSAGMEAAFVDTVHPGDVVVAINGLSDQRMCGVASRAGADVVPVEHEWGTPVDADRVLSTRPSPAVIAAVHAGTQKCLGVAPGLAPFTINDRAFERRAEKPQSWYLDLGLLGGYVGEASTSRGGRTYQHTAPVAMVRSLHAGLGRILEGAIAHG